MATKTIILRPTQCDSVGFDPFPSTTERTDHHLLVTENIADDDATYLSAVGILAGKFYFVPDLNITPLNIRVVARMRTTISGSQAYISYYTGYNATGESIITESFTIGLSEEYTTYVTTIPAEHISSFFDYTPKDIDAESTLTSSYGILIFSVETTSTSSKAEKDLRLTQLYLEIDYNDDSDNEELVEIVYLKENGSWAAIPCSSIYQKQNGLWTRSDSLIFKNGNRFILQRQ